MPDTIQFNNVICATTCELIQNGNYYFTEMCLTISVCVYPKGYFWLEVYQPLDKVVIK